MPFQKMFEWTTCCPLGAVSHEGAKLLSGSVKMKPRLQALLVADKVYSDKATGKYIVAGTFNTLLFYKPEAMKKQNEAGEVQLGVFLAGASAGSPFVYLSLTDIRGKQTFNLRYVHLNDDRLLFEIQFDVDCKDPLEMVEMALLPFGAKNMFLSEDPKVAMAERVVMFTF